MQKEIKSFIRAFGTEEQLKAAFLIIDNDIKSIVVHKDNINEREIKLEGLICKLVDPATIYNLFGSTYEDLLTEMFESLISNEETAFPGEYLRTEDCKGFTTRNICFWED